MKKKMEATEMQFDRRLLENPMVGTSQLIGSFKADDNKKKTYTQYQKEVFWDKLIGKFNSLRAY